ncbi:MAG TPA: UDP-N-acetylmuramate dehydrogenase [Acidimicrobiia bacterium]|jgi:UDP-N-acetylmuramate dehydrogenase|nr:UDP-N-acetylmuramate dehydrogenase [Acidimicrobiia bacterium]
MKNVLATLAAELDARVPGAVRTGASSAEFTTYRCGGPFAVLVRVDRLADLSELAPVLAAASDVEVLVIGRGSNVLVADSGFDGLALVLGSEFDNLLIHPSHNHVEAGGAVALPVLARRSASSGVAGLEFFVGIPGSVGGAVRMNAGGHGAETKDVIVEARVADLNTGTVEIWAPPALGLGYRCSALGARSVVVGATFAGTPDDPAACAARIDDIVRWRREHQPGGQNAGSVFTNPPGDAAGRLIESCGLKGHRIGSAVVSEKHANFFVAEPGARADDVFALIRDVQHQVAQQTSVQLEPELRLVGFHDERKASS